MQLGLFERLPDADRVPTGGLVGLAYRVRWTYTGWRCSVFGERHTSEPMTREEARRLFASRATMVGVGRVELLVQGVSNG